jgi:hypothetical protein
MRRALIWVADVSSTTTPHRIPRVWGFLWGTVEIPVWKQHPKIEDVVPTPSYCSADAYLGNAGGDALTSAFLELNMCMHRTLGKVSHLHQYTLLLDVAFPFIALQCLRVYGIHSKCFCIINNIWCNKKNDSFTVEGENLGSEKCKRDVPKTSYHT